MCPTWLVASPHLRKRAIAEATKAMAELDKGGDAESVADVRRWLATH